MAINAKQTRVGSIVLDRETMRKATQGLAEGTKYTGAGDVTIEFGNAQSFLNETNSGRVFTIKIANASAADAKIALYAGDIASLLTGYTAAVDGTIATSITGSARPSSIACMAAYGKHNPTRICKLKIQADDVAQMSEAILFRSYDPFKNSFDEYERIPENYQSQMDNNTKTVEIDDVDGWYMGSMTALLLNVQAGRTVTLAIACGASFDSAKALMKKQQEAAENVARVIANA